MKKLLAVATVFCLLCQSSVYALTTLWDTSTGMYGLGFASSIPGDPTGEQTKYGLYIRDDFRVGAPGWVVKKVTAYGRHDAMRTLDQLSTLTNWVLMVDDGTSPVASYQVPNPTYTLGANRELDLVFGDGSSVLFTLQPGKYYLTVIAMVDATGRDFTPGSGADWGNWWYWRVAPKSNAPDDENLYWYTVDRGQLLARPGFNAAFTIQGEVVPEPTTLVLFGSGITAVAMRLRRR